MDVAMPDQHDLDYWAARSLIPPQHVTMLPPDGAHDVLPCTAVGTRGEGGVLRLHVLWQPSPEDVEMLVRGGQLWMSAVGGLPPHWLEVQPPPS